MVEVFIATTRRRRKPLSQIFGVGHRNPFLPFTSVKGHVFSSVT